MKLHPWFKTALVVVGVVGPIYWLMFSADGQRRMDSAMLSLFGAEALELDLTALDSSLSEAQLRTVYPRLAWDCVQRDGQFGDGVCASLIGTYNEMPAYGVSFHFADARLNALQVDYRPRYHDQLLTQLRHQLGAPAASTTSTGEEILQWRTAGGVVVAKARLDANDQAALIWLAFGRSAGMQERAATEP